MKVPSVLWDVGILSVRPAIVRTAVVESDFRVRLKGFGSRVWGGLRVYNYGSRFTIYSAYYCQEAETAMMEYQTEKKI